MRLASERDGTATPALVGRVVDRAGKAVDGASVAWMVLGSRELEWEPAWQRDDWGPLDVPSEEGVTNAVGGFEFSTEPEARGSFREFVWVQRAGYAPGFAAWAVGSQPEQLTIELEQARPVEVIVLDEAGQAVEGVRVEHFGLTPADAGLDSGGVPGEQRSRRYLTESARTDARGRVDLTRYPGEQVVRAIDGSMRSLPWRGEPQESVTLRLHGTFTVGGRVTLPDWSHLDYVGERRITVSSSRGGLERVLASLRGVQPGPWGPVELPLIEGAEYSVRISGSPIIPQTKRFSNPYPGGAMTVDLDPGFGHDLTFAALDENGDVILDSEALVWWEQDGEREFLRRRSMPDGQIAPYTVPAGTVEYVLSADGYVPERGSTVEVPMPTDVAYTLTLRRAARLRGRCLHDGKPVEDFEVAILKQGADPDRTAQRLTFHGRQDGTFEVDTVPAGLVLVSASSEALPPCEPVPVQMPENGVADVTLELETPVRATGLVVDAWSGGPIAAAEVRLLRTGQWSAAGPRGRPSRTGPDGTFALDGLSRGRNLLEVTHPDYATRIVSLSGRRREIASAGLIALAKPQRLTVRLLADDNSVAFTDWTLRTEPPSGSGPERFPPDGTLELESVDPGETVLFLERPDLGGWIQALVDLRPGEDWEVVQRIEGERYLDIEVVASDEVDLSEASAVYVSYRSRRGQSVVWGLGLPSNGLLSMSGIDGDVVAASIAGNDFRTLATAQGSYAGDDYLRLEVPLDVRPLRLTVLGPGSEPVAGANVTVRSEENDSLSLWGATDASGVAEIRGVPTRPVRIAVTHPSAGARAGVRWTRGPGELTLELRNDAGLEVRVVDGSVPVSRAEVELMETEQTPFGGARTSDQEGRVSFSSLSPGPYVVRVRHRACWPTAVELAATPDPEPVRVEVRRVGDLELEVRDPAGATVRGALVRLESLELGASVSDWVASGAVEGDGLTTGADGRVALRGLPHGDYAYVVESAGSNPATGTLTVAPASVTLERVELGR